MNGEEMLKRAMDNGAERAQELDRATESLRECLTQDTPVDTAQALADVLMDCCKLIAKTNARLENQIDGANTSGEAISGLLVITALAAVIAKMPEVGTALAAVLPEAYKVIMIDYELFDISMSANCKEPH